MRRSERFQREIRKKLTKTVKKYKKTLAFLQGILYNNFCVIKK